jgi:DNA-binding NarL/FixJ family response regulator
VFQFFRRIGDLCGAKGYYSHERRIIPAAGVRQCFLACVAQRILQRTNEVRIEAKAKEIKLGRKRIVNRQKVLELRALNLSVSKIAEQLNIGRSTVYKVLKEIE